MAQSQLLVTLGCPVNQRFESESLDESLQLALGKLALREIHEVCSNPAFGEEAQCLPGFRAFLQPEDLNFHDQSLSVKRRAR